MKSFKSAFFLQKAACLLCVLLLSCETSLKLDKPSPVDLVYPQLDTENSRWFFFSSACQPFGMVNLSPDTETDGAWNSGYRYQTDTVKGFSHIHAWQLSGLSVMPVTFDSVHQEEVFHDYYSHFSHEKEIIKPGLHHLYLDRYHINVDLTSTTRVGLHRYQFNDSKQKAILISLEGQLGPSKIINGSLTQIDEFTLQGELTNAPTFRRPKPTKVFFTLHLSVPVLEVQRSASGGKYLISLADESNEVLLKAGLSYTSVKNASFNISKELPGWDFQKTVDQAIDSWNKSLSRIMIEGGTDEQQRRFYTDLWHALQGRRIINDANGFYPDYTSSDFQVKRLPLDAEGEPLFNHYNSDSFWGAQWTINTLWQLVYPEIAQDFVNSLLQYYQDGGLVPRGPSGGNYTYVMTGASSTPFVVGAYQKGIKGYDSLLAFEALKKNHLPGGIMEKAGYEHNTNIGGGLSHYIKEGFVPYPLPEGQFGSHQDGASLTLEYAFQDYALAQLAKALGEHEDYQYFIKRSQNYQHVFDLESGWMRPKDINGHWYDEFDPYKYEHGFNESNGAQSTWFVPHDLSGLAQLMGGDDYAVEKLNDQFKQAERIGFTSGTAHAKERYPEYSRIPINYGNQPSIQTAFIFSYLGRPDLTQYWSRKVIKAVYEGIQTDRGYNGDEDQGLMGALAVLMKIGLFQMDGGTSVKPTYQIASPSFDKITIKLNKEFYPGEQLVIETINNSEKNVFVNQISWHGSLENEHLILHEDLVRGGTIQLTMDSIPKQSLN